MKILVTGAGGFLGSTIVKHLTLSGYSVRAMLRQSSRGMLLDSLNVEVARGNILNAEEVERAVQGCDIIMHLASIYAFYPWWDKKAESIYKTNVEGTRNLLAAAYKHKTQRFIFTSSIASDYPASSHYAKSKLFAESEVLSYYAKGLPAIILSPAIVFGPGDYKPTPSGEIILKFLNKKYLCYYNALLPIADVDDVAQAHIAAIKNGSLGKKYILCNTKPYRIKEIFKLLQNISGIKGPAIELPYSMLSALTRAEELVAHFIFENKPLVSSEGLRFCMMIKQIDNYASEHELGYKQTPIIETLTKTVNWYIENGYVKNS